ncbi:ABC transporter ATP-binding protein/permease [Enterococcus cecorum]|uniref:ABC transporter ATP-binding protein n=1 Tax=Enterococcus cecorum TaxID=44008 RepID=UPI00148CEF11|nr:ABC transporter ATP-binding protein [Enterococcus cecorum]MCJ0521376.1 ABC transporter ATP-binding protein/permease [Enterococcus cecorum]MCJ0553161.1 ABC transporter ATP-binding protein/permease [Enterococcus cecorum]MCJ0557017.1 ABC transporter ATP-binding protein/permease [Enterococcus cecorum]MCJ0559358.1 ABC transporter ATP-binding protein/permease [Enterococcus cecorum]MCJ0562460.1 ABC transporter ATP-binding protein/permease [Enterococcus cecorum]
MEQQSEWSKSFTLKEQASILKRTFKFARPFAATFFFAVIFSIALAVINVYMPQILQYFMDHYLQTKSATMRILYLFAGLYFATSIIKAFIWFGQWYLYAVASIKTLNRIRVILFEKLQQLGIRYFDQTPAGSIVSRVTNDTETLYDFWNVFMMVLTGILSLVSSFVAMYALDKKIALVNLAFLPLLILIIVTYQRLSSKIYRQMRERLSELNTKLNEYISGMHIIQQFRQENRLKKSFEKTNTKYLRTRNAMIKTNTLLLAPIINFLYAIGLSISLTMFGFQATHTVLEVGMIYAFTTYVQNFFRPMTQVMDSLSTYTDGLVAASRILKLMDTQELIPEQKNLEDAKITRGKIEFKHVSFSYDGKNQVLKDISFVADENQTVALVGHTGSGKSSIINVLMRFYEFEEGQILIDGRDIRDYTYKELRDKIGLVLQDPFMFYGTIADNIRLLNPDITDEEMIHAAKFVQADQFIEELDGDYQAKVIEKGAAYSSGQRQLISFARTVVTNPKILILDEATANIDTETESHIQQGLQNMRQNRTTIAIAHRLSTIRDADLILVLDKGRIVERGNHEELLAKDGLYAQMYALQASGEEI